MNDAKHTKGPWEIAEESILANLDGWRRDFIVVHSTVYNHGQTALVPNGAGELGEANARLIAAAPDLLEACKAALFRDPAEWNILSDSQRDEREKEIGEKLEAAIARAEGK